MYSTNRSFESRQILFTNVNQQTLGDLKKLNSKLGKGLKETKLSFELDKLVQTLLSLEKDNTLLQSILLCDTIVALSSHLELSGELSDYARSKINSIEDNKEELNDDLNKFDKEYRVLLSSFIDASQQISHLFNNDSKSLIDYLTDFEGLCFNLKNFDSVKNSIEKYISLTDFKKGLDNLCENFHSFTNLDQNESYQSIIKLIHKNLNISNNEDLISSFFYAQSSDLNSSKIDLSSNSVERILQRNSSNQDSKSSNYLLSFSEYCKTLYDYFKEKSEHENVSSAKVNLSSSANVSYFSILSSSPASLICKLLFEDTIKPQIIESLTQKLNLNLSAIILHNSCPRLKLSLKSKNPVLLPSNSSVISETLENSLKIANVEKTLVVCDENEDKLLRRPNSDVFTYSLNSFYTILNESDIVYCSRKKPDEFVRDLLFKVLKYCKRYLISHEEDNPLSQENNPTRSTPIFVTNNIKKRHIDLKTAHKMYQSAEFKSILNESQELQHLNLNYLKNDKEKLCFFINLNNLLCIHSHFYFTSMKRANNENDESLENLFQNETETLMFKQRMCYKVGQMGCVSLYDLKHLILMRKFFKDSNLTQNVIAQPTDSINQNLLSKVFNTFNTFYEFYSQVK